MFKSLVMVLVSVVFISCGSTQYTAVDKTNLDRFKHDQKVVAGMSREQVLEKFGTPDEANELEYSLEWSYYGKIFCGPKAVVCAIYFDRDNLVVRSFNIRMEYGSLVVGQ